MAISPISVGDSGAVTRPKLNEAIVEANKVAGKAEQTALAAEEARATGEEAAIRAEAVTEARRQGASPARAGEMAARYFVSANIGTAGHPLSSLPDIDPSWIVTAAGLGDAVRLTNIGRAVAPRWGFHYEPGHLYEVPYLFRRASDPVDPTASIVSVGARYYDAGYAEIGSNFTAYTDVTVASGRREIVKTIGLDWVPPVGTVIIRPYIVAQGTDHTTDVVAPGNAKDITNSFGVVERVIGATSGRLAVCGDSLGGVYYTLPHKAWINILSSLTDWQVANFSLSGDDTLEAWSRLQAGTTIYGSLSLRDFAPAYTLIPLFANDANVRWTRTRLWIENFRRLVKAIKSAGSRPVVLTEGRKDRAIELMALSVLAREEGALYWEISGEYFRADGARDPDYHYNDHPNVRHTWHYANAIRRRLPELGRPKASLKLFQPRRHRQLFDPAYSWSFAGGTTRCMPSAANDGTLVGTAALVADAVHGYVYQGSASGDRMTFGGAPAMPASYSFVNRVVPASIGVSRNLLAGFTTGRLNIMLNNGNLWIRHGSGSAQIDTASGIAADGVEHHIAITYNVTTQVLTAYLDGAVLATATGVPAHNCTDPQIGASGTGSSWIGKIAAPAIYDRALDGWQVAMLARQRDGLLWETRAERHALWQEIEVGHYALTAAQRPYYDKLQSITPAFTEQNSEYQTLQQGGSVSFVDKALLQFVVPGNGSNTRGLRLRLKGADGATLYWLSRRPTVPAGGNAYNKSRGFLVSSWPGVSNGDVYSFSGTDYTVNGIARNKDGAGFVVWCFPETSFSDVSGTLTRVSGSGPNTIAFTNTLNFADGPYYSQIDRPYARWLLGSSISADLRDGQAAILAANVLRQVLDEDVVTVLIEKAGAFTLSDIELRWFGVPEKDGRERPEPLYRDGTELLAKTDFAGLGGSAWTGIGGAAETTPADGVTPYGLTKSVIVSKDKQVRQALTLTPDQIKTKLVQIRIMARKSVPKFMPSAGSPTDLQELAEIAPITSDTADTAFVVVSLDKGDPRYALIRKLPVGLAPQDLLIDVDLPNERIFETTSYRLTISGEGYFGQDAEVEVYEASVLDCGPGLN